MIDQSYISNELFNSLINSSREAFIAINENGKIFLFNPAAAKMFDRTAEEMIGNTLDDLLPKEYLENHQKYVKNYFSSGKSRGALNRMMELPAVRSNGEEFLIEISLSAGQATGKMFIVAVLRDITERKRAEAALRSSEERYRSLQDNLPLGIYRSTPRGKIISVNNAFISILGYKSRFEVLHLSSGELYVNSQARKRLIKKLEKDGAVSNFEAELYKSDGSTLWTSINVKAAKDSEGIIRYFDGIVEDISDRKLVERALIDSEKKYRTLIETAQDIIIAHDLEGKIIYTNQAALKSLKYNRKDVEGKSILDFISPDNAKDVIERQQNRITGNTELLLYNINLIDSEGNYIPFEVSSSVMEEEGKPKMCMVFGRDLSSRKQLEDQLHQSQKMDSIGTLAGGIAHDFNNLLTIINGLSEITLRKLKEKDPLYRDLRSIHAAGRKAEELTRKLLTFSRKQFINPTIIDINLLIADLEKMIRRLIREDIQINKKLYPQALHIKADPGQIEQILINLIVNARDAIGEKSGDGEKIIEISTQPKNVDSDFVKLYPDSVKGDYHMISVSDNGIGMSSEILDKIFEPFFTTKEKGHGTGLGMATVYGILKQNNGFVTIETQPNEGTKISIYWPSADDQLPLDDSLAESIPDDNKLKGSEQIVVVEDDPDVRYFTSFALKNLGYNVIEFNSGLNAHEYLKQQKKSPMGSEKVDLVITDLIMPGMNGQELAKKVKKISKEIKIIYTSGYTEEYIYNKDILSDGSIFLPKPFTMKTLAEEVRRILDLKN